MATRVTSRSQSAPTTAAPAGVGHNSEDREEAERLQLISFISQLGAADAAVEAAKAPFDAAKKARRQIILYAKAAGFTAEEIAARRQEMDTPSRDMAEQAARERKHRIWLGILDPEQTELFAGNTPVEVKDEAHWRAEGYKNGLRGGDTKPPKECPERFVQPWLQERARGWDTAVEAMKANAPKPMPSVREQAAADFKADNPDVPEPGSPEAKAAERKAIAKAKASLEKMGAETVEAGGAAPPVLASAQNDPL